MPLLTSNPSIDQAERQLDPEQPAEAVGATRLRILSSVALTPLITGYLAIAALLAVITASASAAEFSTLGVLGSAGPGWLAAFQVPLQIAGQPLGVLPLLATVGVCVLVARTASGAAQRMGGRQLRQIATVVGVMAVAHALFGLVLAMAVSTEQVRANPGLALAIPGLLAGASAFLGVIGRGDTMERVREYLDPVALRGLRAGVLGMSALLACGAVVFLFSLVSSLSTAHEIFARSASGAGSGFGMLLLSVGYLPNAVVFAFAFIVGPGFSIGSMSLVPYSLVVGPVPGVPLLAGLPEQQASWWPFLMFLPAVAGLLVGWVLRRSHEKPLARVRAVLIAGALVGFICVLLGSFAGGRLGSGGFDPVTMPVGLFSVASFFWIAVPGVMVAWFAGPRAAPAEPAEDLDGGPDTVVMASIDEDFDEDGVSENPEVLEEDDLSAQDEDEGLTDDSDSEGLDGETDDSSEIGDDLPGDNADETTDSPEFDAKDADPDLSSEVDQVPTEKAPEISADEDLNKVADSKDPENTEAEDTTRDNVESTGPTATTELDESS